MLLSIDDELQTDLVCGNGTLKNSKQDIRCHYWQQIQLRNAYQNC